MKIITQDCELVDLDRFAKVEIYVGEVDNTTVYLVIGTENLEPNDDEGFVLGVYNDEVECSEVFVSLVEALNVGKLVYQMPEPAIKEGAE